MKLWLFRVLAALVTTALVVLGFFFFTVALAIGVVVALVLGVRLWWTLRKLKRSGIDPMHDLRAAHDAMRRDSGNTQDGALEGDYQVVEREHTTTRLPPAASVNNTPPER